MTTATQEWDEVGVGVFRRRQPGLDLNVGVVVGDGEVLLVDTGAGPTEAAALHLAVRRVSPHPVRHVVNTHFHFNHTFGNSEFSVAAIWAHPRCAAMLGEVTPTDVAHLTRTFEHLAAENPARASVFEALASDVRAAKIVLPGELVGEGAVVDVGGRRVELHHLGRGHTDGDLVAAVPDAGVVFAGGLVRGTGEPRFVDAWPLEWPATLLALLRLGLPTIVPGHGVVMGPEDVTAQTEQLVDIAHLCTLYLRGGMNDEGVLRRAPFEPRTSIVALHRAKATLARLPHGDPAQI